MAIFLVSVTSALLAITALGIFGLATFNVSTRIRQIGTRRAVGARKLDIVRHFLVENWMVTTAGIVVGCGAALGIGYWISVKYELPRLDLYYLVGGALAIWLIGLAAALQPARRASGISPAVASRTVLDCGRPYNRFREPRIQTDEGQAGPGTSGQLGRSHGTRHRRQ